MTSAPELTTAQVIVADPRVQPRPRELGTVAYHAATTGKTEVVGTYSGAGATLQGLIAATTKEDSGLVKPLADALNEVVESGTYPRVLKRWGLSDEAATKSEINPPGLSKTNK